MLLQRTVRMARHARLTAAASPLPLSLRYGALGAPYSFGNDSSMRFFSTGMSKDTDPNHPQKELSAFQKLQKWMQPFVSGSKALYVENKQAWAIRSRLKASSSSGSQAPQLTRQEMMILRQAHRDLIKSLPLLIFFAVPLVGYAAPLIGYQFPKQLLPWQFWRPDQKTQFFSEDAQARAHFYPELVDLLKQIDAKDKCLAEMLATHASKEGSKTKTNEGLDPVQVSELVPFFDVDTGGPAAMPNLSSHHVHVLARSIALLPAFSWVLSLAPRNTLENFLEKRMDELRVDDAMLLQEGIDQLSLSELEFACEERGIVSGYGNIEALRGALRDWLAMYSPPTSQKPSSSPQGVPASLLLHAPALMNPTGRPQ